MFLIQGITSDRNGRGLRAVLQAETQTGFIKRRSELLHTIPLYRPEICVQQRTSNIIYHQILRPKL